MAYYITREVNYYIITGGRVLYIFGSYICVNLKHNKIRYPSLCSRSSPVTFILARALSVMYVDSP